jgi:tetratricopeptide (TPR) repeat protein
MIESPKGFTYVSPLITDLINKLKDESFVKSLSADYQSWSLALNQLMVKNLDPEKNINVKSWKADFQNILQLKDSVIELDAIHYARIAYFAEDYQNAIKFFEEAGEIRSKYYTEAKSKFLVKSYPEGLHNMSDSDKKFLAEYLKKSKDYIKAIEVYRSANDTLAIMEVLEDAAKNDTISAAMINAYVDLLLLNSDWARIVEFVRGNGKIHRNILSDLKENYYDYLQTVVKDAATSPILPTLDNKIKGKLSDLFRDEFIQKGFRSWKNKLHPLVVGAAMERAGRVIDCLKYYEKITKLETLDDSTRKNAEIRWIVVKEKQANREEKINLKDNATKHRNEALIKRRDLNMMNFDEPEFPNVAG